MSADVSDEMPSHFPFHYKPSQVYRNEIAQLDYKSGVNQRDEKVMADLLMNSGLPKDKSRLPFEQRGLR